MDMIEQLSLAGLVPVIKVDDAADAVPLCKAMLKGGLPVAEITFRTAAAPEAIASVRQSLPECILGAGTVLTIEQVKAAVAAGAAYILTPGFNPKIVGYCVEHGITIIPGCACPGDIEGALEFGLKLVKIFPAEVLGGVKFLKALSGPYPQMNYLPTGGVNEQNLIDYLAFPKVKAVGGSWMVPGDAVKAKDWDTITAQTRRAINKMLGLELAHIGIYNADAKTAEEGARMLSLITGMEIKDGAKAAFVGDDFEMMKSPKADVLGHIAISTTDLARAKWHLEKRGFSFEEPIVNYEGKTTAVYLKQRVCGFALHLLQK
ncbi:MAG: bifunctional 4-hydroxy-2-oxoglutarate aldolase/2-dehydro-3-deoxy-phosphogluconate aldolase [Clostridia bacterium]|nr:bifunctional 4-hydroxy-2-oxoglutarate aldolase/2-dehydro-3-deoxy-phosphogluconate aldolase [Clostridia bacterium]